MQPLTQLVRHSGNDALFTAVELSVLSQNIGWPLHLHAEGVRGTGKTTVLRSARAWLPRIRRIKGCLFNCDPRLPHCPAHQGLTPEQIEAIGTEWIPMPFLEISHSAKLGTVVGTIDLRRVLDRERPEAVLLPGTIAKAHRGIVFVDEVNRLADTAPELVDVLLDVMGTRPGRLQIEESGLPPVELTVRVAVWAASNPDEEPGPLEDIRRQLSDRFDLVIPVRGPDTVDQVRAVLERTARWAPEQALAGAPERAALSAWGDKEHAGSRPEVPRGPIPAISSALQDRLAEIYVRFGLESLRAMEAWQWAARLNAWRHQRRVVTMEDLAGVAPLVLHHRLEPAIVADVLRALAEPGGEAKAEMAGAQEQEPGPGGRPLVSLPSVPDRHRNGPRSAVSTAEHPATRHGKDAVQDLRVPGADGALKTLVARVRHWLRGDGEGGGGASAGAAAAAGLWSRAVAASRSDGGRPGGAAGAVPPAEMPAPPRCARPLEQLTDEELMERIRSSDRREPGI